MDALRHCLRGLFAPGRGILAVETAPATLAARFRSASLTPSPQTTDRYLTMLLGTAGLAASTSGVVLAPEAFTRGVDGHMLPAGLRAAGILTGVRADTGHEPLSEDARDRVTTGLDGLAARVRMLRDLGASFAVWSAVARPTADRRGMNVLTANSQAAARFAHLCQGLGVLPVVRIGTRVGGAAEPTRSAAAGMALLSFCRHLHDLDVDPTALVISTEIDPDHAGDPVATGPLASLPAGLGGVALTSSGYSLDAAADAVTAVCASAPPWPVTFYVGRHVTRPALEAWHGRDESVAAGQEALRSGLVAASAALGERPAVIGRP